LTQSDEEFNVNLDLLGRCNGAAVALAIEYRWVANQNARGVVCAPHGRIRLSCLPLVNTMLVADKVQNR